MPVWNNAYKTIDNAVNSIIDQFFKKGRPWIEIMFINDGSNDRATKRKINGWVRQLALTEDSGSVINTVRNRGVSCARNAGIRRAAGKYICYLDADDVYYPCRFQDIMFYLEDEDSKYDLIFQKYDKVTYGDDRQIESQSVEISNHVIGLTHLRSMGEVFPNNLTDRVTEVAIDNLRQQSTGVLEMSGKRCGKVYSRPTGQSRTKRMPSSGLGITYTKYLSQAKHGLQRST